MDQDSTKDGAAGDDRRNWRERLGVGQDLPKISDEFGPARNNQEPSDAKPSEGAPAGAQSATKPGTPVARPAPMAPRYARPAAPKPANGSSSSEGTNGANHSETARSDPATPGLNTWAAPSRPARGSDQDSDHHSHVSRAASSTQSPALNTPPAASRAAAYPQAARPSGAAPASTGANTGESFGERLRAQREAAEKLAQQRVAAARERSLRASADALTIQPSPQSPALTSGKPAAKSAGGNQPRFTFAQEEIVAARQETAFAPGTAAESHQQQASGPAPKAEARNAPDDGGLPAPPRAADEPTLYSEPDLHAAGAPEYRHEDDAMFEDDATFEDSRPTLHAAPPRASAADYSAAYREFEDEFEEEPRRRSGPLLLLASLAALAMVSGGAIYLYQQAGTSQQSLSAPPVAEASNVPVIAAPEEPAKAEPPAPQEPQQAAAPTTRKQIYDRIIGEETLEPERIVPTEEAPLRQIQQPRATEAGGENQSGEPLPLPLPPPPGTGIGEQGDLLVPGAANIQRASAEPQPEPELSFPEPWRAAAPGRHPADSGTSMAAAPQSDSGADTGPDTGNPASAEAAASAAAKLRGTAAVSEASDAPVSSQSSIYPEVTEPLAYPRLRTASSPPQDQTAQDRTGEPELRNTALDAVQADEDPEQMTAPVTEPIAAPAAEPEADQIAEAEAAGEPTSGVPLPKAKPEPPVQVARAPQPAPQTSAPQPQRQAAAPASSGPVQIIPTDESQAPTARAAQPQARSAPSRRRTVGREPDPLAGPGSNFASSLNDTLNAAPPRQLASLAPDASTQPQPAPAQPTPAQPTQTDPAGGYLVQLASFRSESEALNAYQRLVQRHPQLVGNLDSRVKEASLGQTGSFWRLGVGPLPNRTEATRLCNALIAAGEKDCLVRQN
jgi:hypothetical protein